VTSIGLRAASERYLSFSLGAEEYAVRLLKVKEVIARPEITPVPQTPPYFLGIMNLRGQVISVLDLRLKLGIKAQQNSETAVIIFDLETVTIGVVVDSVNSVLAPSPEHISEKSDLQISSSHEYVEGVYRNDKRLVLFLNIAQALGFADLERSKQISQKSA